MGYFYVNCPSYFFAFSGLPICFSHAPGCMYVSDTRSDDISGKLNFKTYPEPKVVCLNDKLAKYSVISEYTWNLLNKLEEEIFEDAGNRGINNLLVKEDFNKAVLSLSKHCYSVAILLGFPCFDDKQPFEENDGIAGAILIARALTKLGTKVTFFIDKNSHILKKFLEDCFRKYISSSFTPVRNIDCDITIRNILYHEDLSTPYFTHLIAIERPSRAADGNYYSMSAKNISSRCDHLDLLFNEGEIDFELYYVCTNNVFVGLYCSFSFWVIFNVLSCNFFVLVVSTLSYDLLKSNILAEYSDLMSNRSILPLILRMFLCVFISLWVFLCVFLCVFVCACVFCVGCLHERRMGVRIYTLRWCNRNTCSQNEIYFLWQRERFVFLLKLFERIIA